MADRFVLKQFAGNATNNGAFGAAQATGAGVQPVANIKDVQSLNAFEQGWNSATLTADKLPALEEMQGLEALLCKAIKENYSEGIPLWISGETYYQDSRAVYNGKVYRNKTGSYTANNPATDTANWELDKPDTAGTADKLGSSTVGSATQGIYLNNGVPTPMTAEFANQDLSNLSATGQAVINGKADIDASNFNSTGKSLLSGFGMPDTANAQFVSNSFASSTDFNAPASGWYCCRGMSSAAGGVVLFMTSLDTNYGVIAPYVGGKVYVTNSGFIRNEILPVLKGKKIQVQYDNCNLSADVYCGLWFIPAKGEN